MRHLQILKISPVFLISTGVSPNGTTLLPQWNIASVSMRQGLCPNGKSLPKPLFYQAKTL
jgi:hypothetical protein